MGEGEGQEGPGGADGRSNMAELERLMEEQRKRRSELGEYIDRLKVRCVMSVMCVGGNVRS